MNNVLIVLKFFLPESFSITVNIGQDYVKPMV